MSADNFFSQALSSSESSKVSATTQSTSNASTQPTPDLNPAQTETAESLAPVAKTRLDLWKEKRELLDAIELADLLDTVGAHKKDRLKYKVDGVGNIILKKRGSGVWLNGNTNEAGHGCVDLAKHILNFASDTEAMAYLSQAFPEQLNASLSDIQSKSKKAAKDGVKSFTPPVASKKVEDIDNIKKYLIEDRHLPLELVEREIKAGRIYATRFEDTDETGKPLGTFDIRAVFIGPVSAEIRSTRPKGFKGCCTGSDSDRSGYQVMFQPPHQPVIAITEAAIDALSYHTLHPHHFTISTNGAGRFPLQYKLTLEAYRNGFSTHYAFDRDWAGERPIQRLFNALYVRDALAKQLELTPDDIDLMILEQKIKIVVNPSPHINFINEKEKHLDWADYPKEYAVHEGAVDEHDEIQDDFVATGEHKPATIVVKVLKAVTVNEKQDTDEDDEKAVKKTLLKRGSNLEFTLTPEDIQHVLKTYKIKVALPPQEHDWNDELKKYPEYTKKYQKMFSARNIDVDAPQNSSISRGTQSGADKIQTGTQETGSSTPESTNETTQQQSTTPFKATGRFARKPITSTDTVQKFKI